MAVFVAVFVIAASAFGIFVQQAVKQAESRQVPPEAVAGKTVFQRYACIECHTVFGNGGYFGGDLTRIYNKYGAGLPKVLSSARPLTGFSKRKQHLRLTPQEAEEVAAYLKFINGTDNLQWPPRTILD